MAVWGSDPVVDHVTKVLAEHYPTHEPADVDAKIRENFDIKLPSHRQTKPSSTT